MRILQVILWVPLVFLFASCSPPAEKAVPKLIKKLSSSDRSERNQAALVLAGYGPEAKPATKALIKLLKDPSVGVRSSAAFALRSIDTPESVRALEAYQKK